jgi:hypothetical protein
VEEMNSKDSVEMENDYEIERNPVITTLWIGFTISVLSIIGILVVTLIPALGMTYDDLVFRIILGVFVIGVLILFFALILRRLRRKGIDYFVTGAITAYIGFLLVALPAILFAIGVTTLERDYIFYIIMVAGLLFIIFGFFFEAYDLNLKIIALMKKIRQALKKMWERINWKLLLSPWNLFSVAGITIIILTAINILIWMPSLYWYLIGGGLILINIIWHFRKEIAEIFVNIGKFFATMFQAWWRAIKQIPQIIKRFTVWIYQKTVEVLKVIGKSIKYIIVRNYLILFVFGIAMFLVFHFLNIFTLEVRIALSALVCGVAIVKPILDWREHFGEDISNVRMYLYKTAQKTRGVVQRRRLIRCPYCNRPNEITKETCWNCEEILPKCMICNSKIERGTKIARCQLCDNIYHINHLETWLRFNPKCPVCKEAIDKKEEEFLPESTYLEDQ